MRQGKCCSEQGQFYWGYGGENLLHDARAVDVSIHFPSSCKPANVNIQKHAKMATRVCILNYYNFRAEQRVSSNLIGRAVPYMTLYKPLKAVYITFSRPGY